MAAISSQDPRALKKLVQQQHSGSVSTKRDVVYFHTNGLENRPVTFHTHYITRERHGYQPPSKIDLQVFIEHPKTHTHFIVTSVGIYVLHKNICKMRTVTKNAIIQFVQNLQNKYKPGKRYHDIFLAKINDTCPQALQVQFVQGLGSKVPTPQELKNVPLQACGTC